MRPSSPSPFGTGSPPLPGWVQRRPGRVVVLGADGFIGAHVVRTALLADRRVTAVCVKEPWRLEGLKAPGLTVVRVPLGRWWERSYEGELVRLLTRVDALVHLAYRPPAPGSVSKRTEEELETNAVGTYRIARAAARSGVRVIFASSADVYGSWHDKPVDERTVPRPISPYARAKVEAEQLAARALTCSAPLASLRIATVFGPGENGPRAIPSFIGSLLRQERPVVDGDGVDCHDYVHVGDVAGAIVNACCAELAGPDSGPAFNVGSGVGRTTLDVFAAVTDAAGIRLDPVFAPSLRPLSRLVLDPSRARQVLGFRPRADFVRGIKEEYDWMAAAALHESAAGLPPGLAPLPTPSRGA